MFFNSFLPHELTQLIAVGNNGVTGKIVPILVEVRKGQELLKSMLDLMEMNAKVNQSNLKNAMIKKFVYQNQFHLEY